MRGDGAVSERDARAGCVRSCLRYHRNPKIRQKARRLAADWLPLASADRSACDRLDSGLGRAQVAFAPSLKERRAAGGRLRNAITLSIEDYIEDYVHLHKTLFRDFPR
jgi:hypothetical protein